MNARDYYLSIRDDRNAWRSAVGERCMWCGCEAFGGVRWLEIHEMLRKSHSRNDWGHRCNYLLACNSPCHEKELAAASHVSQLACKYVMDREHFDLRQWLTIRNPRAMEYVTLREIQDTLRDGWRLAA